MTKKKSSDSNGRSVASAQLAIERTNQLGTPGLLDDCLEEARKRAQVKQLFDGQVLSADETIAQLICIPMPALAPRFLFGGDGWPLSRFFMVSGEEESCKSAFLNEVGTWHRALGGHYVVIETEQKDGTGLRNSFFNYDKKAWHFTRARSQDEWNRIFFWWVEQFHGMMDGFYREASDDEKRKTEKKKKNAKEDEGAKLKGKSKWNKEEKPTSKTWVEGRGRIAPICLGVDSLSAVLIERFMDEMLDEGAPDLNHPLGAKLLSDFFKVGPKSLTLYPITFMAVSHLRHKQASPQTPHIQERVTTGGKAPRFQMTTEIEMKRLNKGQEAYSHDKYGEIFYIPLSMLIRKNSLAPHEFLNVKMGWYFDPDDIDPLTGEKRQKSFFDWHSATIELLMDCAKAGTSGKGFSAGRAGGIRDLIDLHGDSNRRLLWSKALEIGEKEKVNYFEAGQILEAKIQAEPEFRNQLYELMGIRQRRMFQPGVDLREQIKEYHKDIVEADARASAAVADLATDEVPVQPGA